MVCGPGLIPAVVAATPLLKMFCRTLDAFLRTSYKANVKHDEKPDELLRWSVALDGDHVLVALDGEMDMSNAQSFTAALRELVDTRPAAVIVDLRDLSYLDSSGIHCFVNTAAHASTVGCDLIVENPPHTVRRVMELCGVVEFLLPQSNGRAAETH